MTAPQTQSKKLSVFDSFDLVPGTPMPARYSSTRKKAEFTPEERKSILQRLQEARKSCSLSYAVRAAGFWLHKQAPLSMRSLSHR